MEIVENPRCLETVPALPKPLPYRQIIKTWYPLAASWILMAAELPIFNAVIARLPEPEINLAAFGGIVFPITYIMVAPVEMLLAASTALSKDWPTYQRVRQFMLVLGGLMTLLHAVIAFSPLYYVIVRGIIHAPEAIIEPARPGLMLLTLFTWGIGYRRFQQGVMIRYGYSKAVGIGTVIRLMGDALVLLVGFSIGSIPGVVLASTSQIIGILLETGYTGWRVRPVLREHVRSAPEGALLTWKAFFSFYIPLMTTSMFMFFFEFIGAFSLSRMPQPVQSLAGWPVVSGLMFMFQCLGVAYNEVVVALVDRPNSFQNLRRFALILFSISMLLSILIAATPLSDFWFLQICALTPELAHIARIAFWIMMPVAGLNVLQSWFQGSIMHGRKTRGITEAIFIGFVSLVSVMWAGVIWNKTTGLYFGTLAYAVSGIAQTAWLYYRSRPIMKTLRARDGG